MKDSEAQRLQELEYAIPYHYLPRICGDSGQVISGMELDWAAEYLLSLRLVEQYISKLRPANLLDVGCGDGRVINEMAQLFSEIQFTGLDYSERAIRLAGVMGGQENVSFECINLNSTSNEISARYDLVTSIEVLEHIHPELCPQFFERNVNMVNQGGYFLLIVPHINKSLIKKHFQHFSGRDIKVLVGECNRAVEIIEFRYLDRVGPMYELMRRFVKNRIYTLHPLWQVLEKMKLRLDNEQEKSCGRLLCLMRCE